MSDARATAGDVADPAAVSTSQVPGLVSVVAADGRRVAVASHPAAENVSRHVGTTHSYSGPPHTHTRPQFARRDKSE